MFLVSWGAFFILHLGPFRSEDKWRSEELEDKWWKWRIEKQVMKVKKFWGVVDYPSRSFWGVVRPWSFGWGVDIPSPSRSDCGPFVKVVGVLSSPLHRFHLVRHFHPFRAKVNPPSPLPGGDHESGRGLGCELLFESHSFHLLSDLLRR